MDFEKMNQRAYDRKPEPDGLDTRRAHDLAGAAAAV